MSGSENPSSSANATAIAAARTTKPNAFRQFVESLLCLALAVIVFRTFEVEGYMISTGSMAPALLGFHKQVVCPTCGFPFAYGVAYQSDSPRAITGDGDEHSEDVNGYDPEERQLCTCPNCGQRAIDISQVPRNQGDQLLVFREAYWTRMPHRWEVIVFRNPYDTTQAYVKRLAGLPGETIAIRYGDVYANGILCRKDYATQKAVRIPVYLHNYEPKDDPEWQSRWRPDDGWVRDGQGFVIAGNNPTQMPDAVPNDPAVHGLDLTPEKDPWAFVTYGHYVRLGGRHETAIKIPTMEEVLDWPQDMLPATYDDKTRQLSITGAMPIELWDRLRKVSKEAQFLEAIDQLYFRSHLSPVMDDYGYNRFSSQSSQNAVRDVMISVEVQVEGPSEAPAGQRQFAVDVTDNDITYRLLLDYARKEIKLLADPDIAPDDPPLRTASWNPDLESGPCQIEMSLFDRQVTAAINGEEPFEAWEIPTPVPAHEPPRFPVRFGSRGLAARVKSLEVYRDVYYTSKPDDKPYTLEEEEFYVLGDNSPVSLDSRRWKDGAVPMQLLLGKPFVVHLPSRQMKIRIGDSIRHIRIPDFPRVRYIR